MRNSTILCERCDATFKTMDEYHAHKILHNTGQIPDRSINEVLEAERLAGLPPEPEVEAPDPTQETPNLGQQATPSPSETDPSMGKLPESGSATGQQVAQWRAKKGITLIYKFDGYCDCGREVDTLTLDDITDDKKKVVVVAWCTNCKKKHQQRTVVKL